MFKYVVLIFIAVLLLGAALVRLRPLQPAAHHSEEIGQFLSKGINGAFSVGDGGDIAALLVAAPLGDVASQVSEIILNSPRTTTLAGDLTAIGDPDIRRSASYVTRSALWGFPDVTTVQLDQTVDGVRVSVHGRLVYGKADFGVNEARIRGWLDQFGAAGS